MRIENNWLHLVAYDVSVSYNFFKKVKIFYFNFLLYSLTISHKNWYRSLSSSIHCKWSGPGTTCHRQGCYKLH